MRVIKDVRHHILAAAAGLAFLVVALSQALGARPSLPAFWRGYCALVVADSVPLRDVLARLERGIGASRIVSAETSSVSVTVFGGREEVMVADLERRFEPRDPRLDEYMLRLPAMFRVSADSGSAHVLYLRSGFAPMFLSLRVGRLLRGLEAGWSLAEPAPLERLAPLAAALLYLVLLVGDGKRIASSAYLGVAALPWLLNCFLGGLVDLLAYYLVFPFACALLTELRSRWSGFRRPRLAELVEPGMLACLGSLGAAVGMAGVLVLVLGDGRDAARVLTALAADGVLLAAAVAWDRNRWAAGRHRVFIPVAIGRRTRRAAGLRTPTRRPDPRLLLSRARGLVRERKARASALLALVLLSPLAAYLGGPPRVPALPVPIRAGAASASWESLQRLWVLSRADELPSYR